MMCAGQQLLAIQAYGQLQAAMPEGINLTLIINAEGGSVVWNEPQQGGGAVLRFTTLDGLLDFILGYAHHIDVVNRHQLKNECKPFFK